MKIFQCIFVALSFTFNLYGQPIPLDYNELIFRSKLIVISDDVVSGTMPSSEKDLLNLIKTIQCDTVSSKGYSDDVLFLKVRIGYRESMLQELTERDLGRHLNDSIERLNYKEREMFRQEYLYKKYGLNDTVSNKTLEHMISEEESPKWGENCFLCYYWRSDRYFRLHGFHQNDLKDFRQLILGGRLISWNLRRKLDKYYKAHRKNDYSTIPDFLIDSLKIEGLPSWLYLANTKQGHNH